MIWVYTTYHVIWATIALWRVTPKNVQYTKQSGFQIAQVPGPSAVFQRVVLEAALSFNEQQIETVVLSPFKNAQRWMGNNTFPILLVNDDIT